MNMKTSLVIILIVLVIGSYSDSTTSQTCKKIRLSSGKTCTSSYCKKLCKKQCSVGGTVGTVKKAKCLSNKSSMKNSKQLCRCCCDLNVGLNRTDIIADATLACNNIAVTLPCTTTLCPTVTAGSSGVCLNGNSGKLCVYAFGPLVNGCTTDASCPDADEACRVPDPALGSKFCLKLCHN